MRSKKQSFADGMRGQQGMSLIEIIIVISLLLTLMTVIVTNLTGTQDSAMVDTARISMGQLESTLQMYKVHHYAYPKTLEDLVSNTSGSKKWRGPYAEKSKLKDPWGTDFDYKSDGRTFQIISGGPDKQIGTEDDIVYPDEEGES